MSAQTLSGTVRGGGAAVVGATVRLLELDRVQHTGAGGQFAFSDVPAGHLSGVRRGHGVRVGDGQRDSFRRDDQQDTSTLRPSAVPLKEVVVSASPDARTTSDSYQPDGVQVAGGSAEQCRDEPGREVLGCAGRDRSRPTVRRRRVRSCAGWGTTKCWCWRTVCGWATSPRTIRRTRLRSTRLAWRRWTLCADPRRSSMGRARSAASSTSSPTSFRWWRTIRCRERRRQRATR